jgi:two-component system cell cycle response regulator DivK
MPTILYVEDDANSREVMQLLLKRVLKLPDIIIMDDNSNFMDKVHSLPAVPDIIFLDIQMRPHDGYSMLKMLRADPLYQNSLIIAMTANVMANDVKDLKTAGFNGLIGKPIIRQVFPELMRQILTGQPVWYVS